MGSDMSRSNRLLSNQLSLGLLQSATLLAETKETGVMGRMGMRLIGLMGLMQTRKTNSKDIRSGYVLAFYKVCDTEYNLGLRSLLTRFICEYKTENCSCIYFDPLIHVFLFLS